MTRQDLRSIKELLGLGPRPAIVEAFDDFDAYCDRIEQLMGIANIDGNEKRDGYGISSAFDAWKAHFSAEEYASGKRVDL